MGLGFLKVETRTAEEALPVSGAIVTIKDTRGGVLYRLVTDESGNTATISLFAPDKIHTLYYNDPGPYYATYIVEVRNAGYIETNIRGVQIFDTITSIQPVTMIPKPEPPAHRISNPIEIDIPPADLTVESEWAQVGVLDSGRTFREVVIPEYITVHLDRPTVEARNIRVKFADYIKNVASSEIYPTWPQSSLISNIYAIISFALNRVYTEWYRSRGFAFDITNSTTVDQFFVEGRDIFANISLIVDNIFNQFIRRRGRLEPFFAQFCNGTTVTCPGLSQWGTVTLANQGLAPIQILRYFYPNDIEIIESNNIAAITESYPGTPLREGSEGFDVQTMQRYLNRIRANYPLIQQITNPNGIFYSDTTNAVKTFQNIFNLTPDGIIGRATWYKIVQVYVGVTRLAELESEGERIGIGLTPPNVVLREGSRGENVVELQFILNFIAQFYSEITPVIQDGTFGVSTKSSVMQFQRLFNLSPDGIVGPATWNTLYDVFLAIEETIPHPEVPTPTPPTTPTAPPFPGTLLRVGSRGDNVRLMQEFLNTVSTVYTSIPRLSEDGIFGPITESAVRAFQRQFGLNADGIIGPITWGRIVQERNAIVATPTPPPALPEYPGTALRIGSSGDSVRLMQGYLNDLANVYTTIPRLVVDGIFGFATQDAVMAFQRLFGLVADGIIGRITWNAIIEQRNKII